MELRQTLQCYGYLKTIKSKYVVANQQYFAQLGYYTKEEDYIFLDELGEVTQKTKEFVEKLFKGIIIGKKSVSTETWCSVAFDHNGNNIDSVQSIKQGFVECYHVAFRMGGTRLVPVENVEIIQRM